MTAARSAGEEGVYLDVRSAGCSGGHGQRRRRGWARLEVGDEVWGPPVGETRGGARLAVRGKWKGAGGLAPHGPTLSGWRSWLGPRPMCGREEEDGQPAGLGLPS